MSMFEQSAVNSNGVASSPPDDGVAFASHRTPRFAPVIEGAAESPFTPYHTKYLAYEPTRKAGADQAEKFFIPSVILESKSYKELSRGARSPFDQPNQVVICSYHFARVKAAEIMAVPWDLVVIDEAHRLRNVYKKADKMTAGMLAKFRARKELEMTEGRGTGIPKIQAAMKRNGSPKASFETDENRLWFVAKLPIHPEMAPESEQLGDQVGTKLGPSPDQVTDHVTDHITDHVTDHVRRLLHTLANGELSAPAIMRELKLTHRPTLRANYLHPALEAGLVEMTSPESPRSRQQKYRLTPLGREVVRQRIEEAGPDDPRPA